MGWNTFIGSETIKENEDMESELQTSNSPGTYTGFRGGID
jgi:hypothetical protein